MRAASGSSFASMFATDRGEERSAAEDRRVTRTILGYAALLIAAFVAVAVIAMRLETRLAQLEDDDRFSTVWTATQVEVDLLMLIQAVSEVQAGRGTPADLRLRFDIFYARLETVDQGRAESVLSEDRAFQAALTRLAALRGDLVLLIDGPDGPLLAALDWLRDTLMAHRPEAREISLAAVRLFTAVTDQRRAASKEALWISQGAIGGLLALLALLFVFAIRRWLAALHHERRMAAEKDKFAAIIEAAHDGILLLDARRRVLDANAAMARLAGLPGMRLRGLDVLDLASGETHAACLRDRIARCSDAARTGMAPSPTVFSLDFRHADGTAFPAEVALVAAWFADGGHGMILYVRDVSERQRYEAALVRTRDRALAADQAKSLLLKMVSHELRTPLSVIEGALELFPCEALSEDQAEALAMIRHASDAMTRQVADVLDYSDLKAGRFSLQRVPFELPALLEDLRRGCVAEAARRGLRLEIAGDCPDLRLLGDSGRLSQVLLNFIGNAFKFTRDGSVTVSARAVALGEAVAEIEFAVADTGCGIPRKDQDRIFDEFVALDLGYGRTGSGTGLGLAICRRLVEAMAGEIGVDSEPDHGSRFWIRVPLGRAAAPDSEPDRSQAPASAPPVVPGLAILVAEDHEINALLVRKMLESAGHRVTVARDGFEAVRCAAASRFDAILMDISMPRLDGVEATRLIRAAAGASRDTPVIGLTAHAFSEERRVFLSAGMQECLVKPLQRAALDRVLAPLCASTGASGPEPVAGTPDDPGAPFSEDQARDFLSGLPAGEADALIAAFARSAEEDIACIEAAFESAALSEAEFHAHRLCGIAGAAGTRELARLCAAIERDARAGRPASADAVSRLRPSLDAGLAALARTAAGL